MPDPHFQKQYSHFCYTLKYLPGKTTYLDTPVLPTGAFTGNGTLPVDAELPSGTPVIASVSGPGDLGPYIVDRPENASRTIVIASAASLTGDGLTEVPNPAWDGSGAQPKLIKRDYGFGAAAGTVFLGDAQLPAANVTWGNAQITAIVPSGRRTGQLSVVTSLGRRSVLGVTLSVATPQMHAARPPAVVEAGGNVQAAVDAARPGDLILVKPGVHDEMVVMTKPVRLQGFGAATTAINVVTTPAESVQAWLDRMGNLLLSNPDYMLPNQPAMTPAPFQPGDVAAVVGDEGPGVMVLARNLDLEANGHCLGNFGAPTNEAYCLQNENDTAPAAVAIAQVSRGAQNSGGAGRRLVTVTTAASHLFASGNQVLIQGVTPNAYSGTKTISVTGPNRFTYTVTNNTGQPSLDSATAQLAPQSPLWRPNSRIDGLSLIGASNAPGVLVNGYAHYLEIANARIYTNSGTYAGGIQLGHPGAAAPFNDEDAHNDHVAIHNNMVTQNAANETGGGGGIVLGTGSSNYIVKSNFVAANLTAGNGGGIAHIGRSEVGVIDGNTVVFNESFVQGIGTNGGGIFIGGTPAAAGASTPGSGGVDVTNNLIQGNAAAGGDGGGLALLGFVGSDRVRLYNNMIANNVAGLAGGGVSIAGLPGGNGNAIVDIVHNTIVDNDSTGTAGGAFSSPLTSTPQPAGIAGRGSVTRVRIANSIVWHNRTFYFGRCTPPPGGRCGILPVGASDPTQYAEIQLTNRPYWDLANLSGSQFAPISSVLSSLSGPSSSANYLAGTNDVTYAASNSAAAPLFVKQYFNADRQHAYEVGETTGEATLISVPAALDEGGNFIRPQFGPLSLDDPASTPPNQRFGDYHVTGGLAGAALCSLFTGPCPASVPGALQLDFDGQPRPTGTPHRGADQASQTATPPLPPTLATIAPDGAMRGTSGIALTLTGSNLAGTTLVLVSGSGVSCSLNTSTATTVTATCNIAIDASLGAHNVGVEAPGGTSNTLTFTVVNVPAPSLSSIDPTSGLRGASGLAVTLTGTNLTGATAVNVSGNGVSCSVGSSTPTSVAATCSITAGAALGSRNCQRDGTRGNQQHGDLQRGQPAAPKPLHDRSQ